MEHNVIRIAYITQTKYLFIDHRNKMLKSIYTSTLSNTYMVHTI